MPSHIIRLRGGWTLESTSAAGRPTPPGRVGLPWDWPRGLAGSFRLVRWFQAPHLDPRLETLGLWCENVEGLIAVILNGEVRLRPPPDTVACYVPLPVQARDPGRNQLILDVAWPPAGWTEDLSDREWGKVALLISSRTSETTGPK